MRLAHWAGAVALFAFALSAAAGAAENLVKNPSFEETMPRNQFGWVMKDWGGWKYEGECNFEVGLVAHTGKTSCLLTGGAGAKIRVAQNIDLEPGRYMTTAYIRGLDIGTGMWNLTTEFMFAGKYIQLQKNGTFGWTKLTYVGELKKKEKAGPSFGLIAPGYFWIDDVAMEKVADDAPLTEKPILGQEEAPIASPGELGPGAVRCPECGYRNMPAWKVCYACGTPLAVKKAAVTGPPVRLITSFEDKNPFDGGTIVEEHATDGKKALRIDKGYVCMDGHQDWLGYDLLKADLFVDAKDPIELYIEFRDEATRDYWTRVNYTTVAPPGASTFILPLKGLYVGEKSRPGRMLILDKITRFVISAGDKPPGPLYVDNLRLERDESAAKVLFDGLYALSLGPSTSPVLEGFTRISPATLYSKGRGYGLKDAHLWRAFDVLQPEPLYQSFICIESGGVAMDVPNGKYHVFVNIDNPSGFWGEYQVYTKRSILAQGKPVVTDTMDFEGLKQKYFRFWNSDDLPTDNTFDKYQKAYFHEKSFDVDVDNGQLFIGFQGDNWACSVSAIVAYPVEKAAEGEKFLKYVEDKRRWHFDNYFKRILHRPTGDHILPAEAAAVLGYVAFPRDCMKDVYYNDMPFKDELGKPLAAEAFAGEYAPLTLGIMPLEDLGKVTVTASDLAGPGGTIPASAIDVGFVSYRVTRVTSEGTVYTISPRYIMQTNAIAMPKDMTRRFWLTVKTPADAKPGLYKGKVSIAPEKGAASEIPIEVTVHTGTLDPMDMPAGPWGYSIGVPWQGKDAAAAEFNASLCEKSLRKMREYGFTTFSGVPNIRYGGFKDGQPVLDFTGADKEMKLAKDLGFLAIVSYGAGVQGINAYFQDAGAMNAAGFKDYSQFIKAVYTPVQKHAEAEGWLPVFYNLGDEPGGDDLTRSAENAEAYKKAFPQGPPFFTAASSYDGNDPKNTHFRLAKALHVVDWNLHSEASVKLLHEQGCDWAFYNGGNRWTFGDYLYKCVKQYALKFRISWHWNACAGDPYYALDCREDDYCWCNATPSGDLVPAIEFERNREGLGDYRRLLTLARLAKEKAGTPAAKAAEDLITARLGSFKLGQRDHDPLFGPDDWSAARRKASEAIDALRK